jgi:chaperonin GroEL
MSSKNKFSRRFSLFKNLETNIKAIEDIDNSIKITLGPTGKNGIVSNQKGEISFITSGSLLLKSLQFSENSAQVLLQLFEQAASKSFKISGDGSTTTVILAADLLRTSLRFLVNGYNPIFLGSGLKKISYFLMDKINEFSKPISTYEQVIGVLKTVVGQSLSSNLLNLIKDCLKSIDRDGLILIEENKTEQDELEVVQGLELDKGFASSYFVNDLKNFEVNYEKPSILVSGFPINSLNQLREVIEYVKENNRPLIIVAEEISKDIISTLVLNNIQKKLKVAVIRYSSIKFMKNGLMEDLALLTHSSYSEPSKKVNEPEKIFKVENLGQADKVIIQKEKSTFITSKFSKLVSRRRINELNRELLLSDSDYEKNMFKKRIARLSGNIAKIKIGVSNQYEIDEQRKKVENAINTVRSALEEGILPGGGAFYLHLRNELTNWSTVNLIGEEIFANYIVSASLLRPFRELFNNNNLPSYYVQEDLIKLGYPYSYDLHQKKIVNSNLDGLLDSAKTVRAILWNSITIVSTIITSD